MRRTLAPLLALCAIVTINSVSRGQNGPDADPDAAPGYAKSVFHNASVDSVNVYNGALTLPIAVGPAYPVGPKLEVPGTARLQLRRLGVWQPRARRPERRRVVRADQGGPLARGRLESARGRNQALRHRPELRICYVGPDGCRASVRPVAGRELLPHERRQPAAAALARRGRAFEMWDGDGNRYVFDWHVTGYDDPAAELPLRPRPGPQRLVPDEPDGPVRQRHHARLLQRPR